MKTLTALALAVAGASTVHAAPASAAVLDGPIVDGPILENPIPRAPACRPAAEASKAFNWYPGQSEAGMTWNLGVSATPRIVADCDKLAVELGFGANAKWGPLTVKPFEVVLTGSTDKANKNKATIKYLTFGFKVDEDVIAERVAPIEFTKRLDLTVPAANRRWSWSWEHTFDLIVDVDATVSASAETVAIGGLYAHAEISSTGIRSNLLSSAAAHASARGTASVQGIGIEGGTRIDLFWYAVGGRANLVPRNGAFRADAGYSMSFQDVLGASLRIGHDAIGHFNVFKLDPSQFGDDFSYSKDFTKQF